MILVRDLRGEPLFYIDGDVVRDNSGKPIGEPVTVKDAEARALSARAAHLMTARGSGRKSRGKSGKPVLMDLGPGDVVTSTTQEAFTVPFGDFVAERVSEVRFVKKDRGVWYSENVADATSLVQPAMNGTGAPLELNPAFTKTSFVTNGYAVGVRIPRLVSSNADFDLKTVALHRAIVALRIAREYRVAQLVTTAANWNAANRVAVAQKWNGSMTANPLADLFTALAASALPASMIVMPEVAAQYFFQNANSTAMRDYVQSGGEMPKVVFARAKFTSNAVPAYIWAPSTPTNIALIRSHDTLPTTVTFRWLGDSVDGEEVEGMLAREFFVPGDDADWIVVSHKDAEAMIATTVGAVLTGALQ